MFFISMLAGCRLSHDDFLELQERLRDTSHLEDTSEPTEDDTSDIEEEDTFVPDEPTQIVSTDYAVFRDEGCITFEAEETALTSSAWGFSFRLTKEMFTEGKTITMFQVGDAYISLLLEQSLGKIFFCNPLEIIGNESTPSCNVIVLSFEDRVLEPMDRLTLSFKSDNAFNLFHNKEQIESEGESSNLFVSGQTSFGCPPASGAEISSSWEGGIDSLFLFNRHINSEEVQAIVDAELNDELGVIIDSRNTNFIESFWNLGEDEGQNVIDSVGGNHGQANSSVMFVPYDE